MTYQPPGYPPPAPAPAPVGHTIATTSAPDLRFGSDGRIVGLDAVLDQIVGAVGRQVTPLVRDVALPIIQRDKELQKTVGAAAGKALAQELKPFLWVGLGLLVIIAAGRIIRPDDKIEK
jgi:hypothetical protein